MRVLLMPASYPPVLGGLQTVVQTLARALKERGHDIRVITNKYPRTLAPHEVLDDVAVVRWLFLVPRLRQLVDLRFDLFLAGLFYFPLTLVRLIFNLRRERPDVVNLHFVGGQAFFLLLARWFTSFRLIVSVHGDDVEGLSQRRDFDRWVFRALLRRADIVTACSRYLLEEARQLEPTIQEKARVAYNGIDLPPALPTRVHRGSLFASGRMIPNKGFDVLLRAKAENRGQWRLVLMGDGPERSALESLARTIGLNGDVVFCGNQPRSQVLSSIAEADLVVVPSRKDSFGMAALEAMAYGKPVVATRVSGLPEVLENADALLVEPDDPAQLAKAIESALDRLKHDSRFGLHNRERAAFFSTQHMSDSYLESYSDSRVMSRITTRDKLRSLLARRAVRGLSFEDGDPQAPAHLPRGDRGEAAHGGPVPRQRGARDVRPAGEGVPSPGP